MKKFFIVNHTGITIYVYLAETNVNGIFELTLSARKIKIRTRVKSTFVLSADHANEIPQLGGDADYHLTDRVKIKCHDYTDKDSDNILDLENLLN